MNVEEDSADTLDSALYRRNNAIEDRFGITIVETIADDDASLLRTLLTAGDDTFHLVNLRCGDALTFWQENLVYSISDIPHVDLTQPYWAQKLNDSLTLGGNQYVAIGAYDINVLDLTYALIFNKQMVENYDMESPYTLVNEGRWTIDAMYNMMTEVVDDINGDGKYDENDRWGFLSHAKMVLPNFWIGAGELSIVKDSSDSPVLNMTSERFVNIFNRVFEITWDAKTWYEPQDDEYDVPTDNLEIFAAGNALFMDMSFYFIEDLRDVNTEFGIVPYPKYDESQSEYYSRVSYYWATMVPTSNTDLEMTGAILEALNCESANTVVPAYYDVALKTKYSRDEESAAMLDLIFENRIVDLGDTVLCGDIRDGFMYDMFESNKRQLASYIQRRQSKLNKLINEMKETPE